MLRATHVNMTLTAWLSTMIMTDSFSLHLLFVWVYWILADWDHHAWFMKNVFWFSLPFKHRWFTHTLLFVLLIMLFINLSIYSYNLNYDLSQITNITNILSFFEANKTNNLFLLILLHWHLAWDFLTQRGIPYLWPFFKWNIWFGLFTTGEKSGWNLSGEMVLNFLFSIANILLLSYLFVNHTHYYNIIEPVINNLVNSWNAKTFLIFVWLQLIFILFLFARDIKNYIWNFKDFTQRIFKVLTLSFFWFLISVWIVFVISFFSIDLSQILSNLSNGKILIEWLNTYFIMLSIIISIWYALYLTKKYIVSIASSIAYIINVTYILISFFILFLVYIK